MHFAIICQDKPNHGHVRSETRPTHLEYLRRHKDNILLAGPVLSEDGAAPVGSLLVTEFDDLTAAQTFVDNDPYSAAGLFQTVTIRPWRKVLPE